MLAVVATLAVTAAFVAAPAGIVTAELVVATVVVVVVVVVMKEDGVVEVEVGSETAVVLEEEAREGAEVAVEVMLLQCESDRVVEIVADAGAGRSAIMDIRRRIVATAREASCSSSLS